MIQLIIPDLIMESAPSHAGVFSVLVPVYDVIGHTLLIRELPSKRVRVVMEHVDYLSVKIHNSIKNQLELLQVYGLGLENPKYYKGYRDKILYHNDYNR